VTRYSSESPIFVNYPKKLEVKVVFVDGYCVLCNGFATRILSHTNAYRLKVSTLQGEAATRMIPNKIRDSVDSIMYLRDEELLIKSTAAIYVLSDLGRGWQIMKVLFIFPRFLRDWVYDIIARNRYKWFGKKNSCSLPSASQKDQILD